MLDVQLPVHAGRLNAAVYDDSIIVLGADLNLVFKPETGEMWGSSACRDDLTTPDGSSTVSPQTTSVTGGTETSDFGMVIDDGRLYVVGGRRFISAGPLTQSSTMDLCWTSTDEVRCIDVKTVLSGQPLKPTQWIAHARLPRRSIVAVCGLISVPLP